jgi:hypothetical protein
MMLWGMPPPKSPWPPVTNIRITTSPHSRAWPSGEPVFDFGQQLRRVRAGAEPGDEEKGRGVVRRSTRTNLFAFAGI